MSRTEVLPANLLDHPCVGAWLRVAPGGRPPREMVVLRSGRKTCIYRLCGALEDGPDLIAKRCRTATGRIERTVYGDLMPRCGVPSLRYFGSVPDPDGGHDWLFMEDVGAQNYRQERPEHRAAAGRWLGRLHAAASSSDFEGRLPDRGPAHYLALLRRSRDRILPQFDNPWLPEPGMRTVRSVVADLDLVEAHWAEIDEACARFPRTIVHGDLVIKNVRLRGAPNAAALVAFDWENAGWGIPGSDLAQFTGRTVSPALDAYVSAHGALPAGFDDVMLTGVSVSGAYFRLIDDIAWECNLRTDLPFPYIAKEIATLRVYHGRLTTMFRDSGWA